MIHVYIHSKSLKEIDNPNIKDPKIISKLEKLYNIYTKQKKDRLSIIKKQIITKKVDIKINDKLNSKILSSLVEKMNIYLKYDMKMYFSYMDLSIKDYKDYL